MGWGVRGSWEEGKRVGNDGSVDGDSGNGDDEEIIMTTPTLITKAPMPTPCYNGLQ